MSDATKTRQRLWDSLEMYTIRRDAVLCTLLVAIVLCIQSCAAGPGSGDVWLVSAIIGGITLLPFWCFWIWRTIQIFRRPEDYFFCRCQLSSFHHRFFTKGAMYFTVVLDDPEGGRILAETHAIFQSYGVMEPLLENYTGRTVTIAYNRETEMVVVIG